MKSWINKKSIFKILSLLFLLFFLSLIYKIAANYYKIYESFIGGAPTTGPRKIDIYWESWNYPACPTDFCADPLTLGKDLSPQSITGVILTFSDFTFPREPSTGKLLIGGLKDSNGDLLSSSRLTDIITSLHSSGKRVKISCGGATYPFLPQYKQNPDILANFIEATGTYQLDGWDFDIEADGPANTEAGQAFLDFSQKLRNGLPLGTELSFCIEATVPQHPEYSLWSPTVHSGITIFDYITLQAYNANWSGYAYLDDITALIKAGWPEFKIVLGMNPGPDLSEPPVIMTETMMQQWIASTPNIAGYFLWSANRDTNTRCNSTDVTGKSPGTFAGILASAGGLQGSH